MIILSVAEGRVLRYCLWTVGDSATVLSQEGIELTYPWIEAQVNAARQK